MLVTLLRTLFVRTVQGSTYFVARNISPAENITVAILAYGEGFHNYHHVFPYDYKTAELGDYVFNPTTAFIDFFARIGWAYSLKTMSKETILKRIARTGDGTHKSCRKSNSTENADSSTDKNHDSNEGCLWGWGDKDMQAEDYKYVSVLGSKDAG
jgi:stearoyl-CoA desaturase (delta-9 desaturase)